VEKSDCKIITEKGFNLDEIEAFGAWAYQQNYSKTEPQV